MYQSIVCVVLLVLPVTSNGHVRTVTCQALAELHLARRHRGECTTRTAFIDCYSLVAIELSQNQRLVYIYYGNKRASIGISQDPNQRLPTFLQGSVLVQVVGKKQTVTQNYQQRDLNIFSGYCPNEVDTTVFYGTVTMGRVDGYLLVPQGKFWIEPSFRYLPSRETAHSKTKAFIKHVFYSSEDLIYGSISDGKAANEKGAFESARRHSSKPQPLRVPPLAGGHTTNGSLRLIPTMSRFTPVPKVRILHKQKLHSVRKHCSLVLYLDHKFMRHSARGSVTEAIASALYMVAISDQIFRHTDFDGDGLGDNIGFRVKNVTAILSPDVAGYKLGQHFVTHGGTTDGGWFLRNFSSYNFADVCLAAAFTYRDLANGLLGQAWRPGARKEQPGGICAGGHKESLNTLYVTQFNHWMHIPRELLVLTLAHEFGHAFGARHDNNIPPCTDEGPGGRWLMYPSAQWGERHNNWLFSPCSRAIMTAVIQQKGVCLERAGEPLCGNLEVEEGEECDCGDQRYCHQVDHCCLPVRPPSANKSGDFFWFPPHHHKATDSATDDDKALWGRECSIARNYGYKCSPKVSPCCDADCQVTGRAERRRCAMETECLRSAACDGRTAECPAQVPKPDRVTRCLHDSGVCVGGACESLCVLVGQTRCECDPRHHPNYVCHVCCQKSSNASCVPGFKLGLNASAGGVPYLYPGASCNGTFGVCDAKHRCIRQASDDPKLFEEVKWLQSNWHSAMLTVGGLLTFVILVGILLRIEERRSKNAARHSAIQLAASSHALALDVRLRELEVALALVRNRGHDTSLTSLFPTVTASEMQAATLDCETDEEAVAALVARGYPLVPPSRESDDNYV